MKNYRWVSILAVIFILYSVISRHSTSLSPAVLKEKTSTAIKDHNVLAPTGKEAEMEGSFLEKKLSTIVSNVAKTEEGKQFLSQVLRQNNPSSYTLSTPQIKLMQETKGEGEEISVCGQSFLGEFKFWLPSGEVVFDSQTSQKPKESKLGQLEAFGHIEEAVLGMKKGGMRQVVIPQSWLKESKELAQKTHQVKEVFASIAVKEVAPLMPETQQIMEVFPIQIGSGPAAQCGENIAIHLVIKRLSGDVIFNSQEGQGRPLFLTLDASQFPVALVKGAYQLRIGGVQKVMAPVERLNTLFGHEVTSFWPIKIAATPKEMLLLEIERVKTAP